MEQDGDEHRHKVTLALNDDDVTETIGTMFQKSDRADADRRGLRWSVAYIWSRSSSSVSRSRCTN